MDSLQTAMAGVAIAAATAAATFVLLKPCQKPAGTKVLTVVELTRGTMKEVKVGDQAVLVVHTSDGNFYATSAKCTHYGAPLAKGVLNGNRVVCPWHAACFNVCTGDIEDGPVLDALQSYKVQVTPAGDIYVDVPAGKPVTKGRVPHMCKQSAAADQRHFVIIGAGPAAATAVETMRSEGFQGRITIIAKERALPYDRTKLSKNMAVGADEVALRKPEFYPDALGCEVRLGATVTSVDPSTKTVILEGGERIAYDKLLCASGGPARTFRKPEGFVIPGAESGRIFPLRDSGHSAGIEKTVDALGKDLAVVIVGSSFIGMEAAAYLRKNKGCTNVTVVGMESEPFERVLGPKIGAFMRAMHEAQGVKFHMKSVVGSFTAGADGNVTGAVLKDGPTLKADLVVVGSGIIPATEYLAEAAAQKHVTLLARAPGGVVVDETLRAGLDIFAAGDIVYFPYAHAHGPNGEVEFTRIEHYDVAMDQGRTAARNMMNHGAKFTTVPFFWTAQYGKSLRYAGHALKTDNVIIHGDLSLEKASFTAFFVVHGKVAAVSTLNRDPEAVAAMELIKLGAMPSPSELSASSEFNLTAHLKTVSLANAVCANGK